MTQKKRFDIFTAVDLTLNRIQDVEEYENYKDAIIYNQIIVFLMYVLEKEENLSEDSVSDANDKIQKVTDKFIKNIESLVGEKEKEVLTV